MRLWRVCTWVPDARPEEPGFPLFAPADQGAGRIDNPDRYRVLYLAESPEAAVGEAFSRFSRWDERLLLTNARLPGARKALVCVEIDQTPLDLDDPEVLAVHGIRPSRVVTRSRAVTQAWALRLWTAGRWAGLRWWSALDADWGIVGLWRLDGVSLLDVEPVRLDHPAVAAAARRLHRLAG